MRHLSRGRAGRVRGLRELAFRGLGANERRAPREQAGRKRAAARPGARTLPNVASPHIPSRCSDSGCQPAEAAELKEKGPARLEYGALYGLVLRLELRGLLALTV